MKTRKNCERGGLGTGGHKERYRRGRTLVNIGGPDLERRGRDFERKSDEHQRRGGARQDDVAFGPGVSSAMRMVVEIGAARGPVNPRDAVEQESRGKRSKQEILERSLVVALVIPKITRQNVGGDEEISRPMKIMISSLAVAMMHWPVTEKETTRVPGKTRRARARDIARRRTGIRMPSAMTSTRKNVAKPSTISMFENDNPGSALAATALTRAAANATKVRSREVSLLVVA